ncbi:hypothetical protein C8F01DRAFT_549354 [Mycena amicta]|nr:hypothetical protein C8F01DRAFT_549354 [Mycena amicta]
MVNSENMYCGTGSIGSQLYHPACGPPRWLTCRLQRSGSTRLVTSSADPSSPAKQPGVPPLLALHYHHLHYSCLRPHKLYFPNHNCPRLRPPRTNITASLVRPLLELELPRVCGSRRRLHRYGPFGPLSPPSVTDPHAWNTSSWQSWPSDPAPTWYVRALTNASCFSQASPASALTFTSAAYYYRKILLVILLLFRLAHLLRILLLGSWRLLRNKKTSCDIEPHLDTPIAVETTSSKASIYGGRPTPTSRVMDQPISMTVPYLERTHTRHCTSTSRENRRQTSRRVVSRGKDSSALRHHAIPLYSLIKKRQPELSRGLLPAEPWWNFGKGEGLGGGRKEDGEALCSEGADGRHGEMGRDGGKGGKE